MSKCDVLNASHQLWLTQILMGHFFKGDPLYNEFVSLFRGMGLSHKVCENSLIIFDLLSAQIIK